ncbi:MAG: methylamine dehydrogenase accessory protein MauD [Myxococcales bacterium]|nr:methylamine dehydrogenase accessory protein MauD [Myxococcales bacterium]
MSAALVVSNLLLWCVIIVLGLVIAALVRQLGVLNARIAPVGALAVQEGAVVGEAAPRIAVEPLVGAPIEIGGPREDGRATLLFFLSPSCPVCKTLLPALTSLARHEARRLEVVLASDGEAEAHRRFVAEEKLIEMRYVLSPGLGIAFGVSKLPFAALVDEAGVLRARGLVNTREHLESLLEALELGVGSIQEFLEREPRFETSPGRSH